MSFMYLTVLRAEKVKHSPSPERAYGLVKEGANGLFHHRDTMRGRKVASNPAKIGDVSPEPVASNLRPED